LLTTEILTNAFKHAFPNNRAGAIQVQLKLGNDGTARLVIADNGVGTVQRSEGGPGTMGQTLIGAFTRQLGGTLSTAGPPGTTVTLDFALVLPPQAEVAPSA